MTESEINIAIAEHQGIEVLKSTAANGRMGRKKGWGDGDWKMLPDYCHDLNAIIPLLPEHTCIQVWTLSNGARNWHIRFDCQEASGAFTEGPDLAKVASEFFLRTIGEWKE